MAIKLKEQESLFYMQNLDANSKLVEVVTDADVSDEDCVGNSLLQIWKLNTLVKILKLKFRRDFEAEVWSVFCY